MNDKKSTPKGYRVAVLLALPAVFALAVVLVIRHQLEPLPEAPSRVLEAERTALTLRDGRLHLTAQPFNGFIVERYKDGALRSRSAIANGLLHGLSEGWYTNRVLEVREQFVNGVSHGQRLRWDEEGRKASEAQIVNGKIEGVFRRWHPNGTLAEELTMKHGEPAGWSRAWYPSGCLKAEASVQAGQVTQRQTYADGEKPSTSGT
jgi:antitoxin component YwqK of YwqJK toxin-antitoxin module